MYALYEEEELSEVWMSRTVSVSLSYFHFSLQKAMSGPSEYVFLLKGNVMKNYEHVSVPTTFTQQEERGKQSVLWHEKYFKNVFWPKKYTTATMKK